MPRHYSIHASFHIFPSSGLVLLDICPKLLISLDTDFLAGVQLVIAAQVHVTLEQGDHVTVEAVLDVNDVSRLLVVGLHVRLPVRVLQVVL